MHESANIVLAHWHYFNCSTDPSDLDEMSRSKSPLKDLTPEQFETVKQLWHSAKESLPEVKDLWDSPKENLWEAKRQQSNGCKY